MNNIENKNIIKVDTTFYNLIFKGLKTIIITREKEYNIGLAYIISNKGFEKSIVIEIISITYKRVRNLTDEDAIKGGYANKEILLTILQEFYPNIGFNDIITIIEFVI